MGAASDFNFLLVLFSVCLLLDVSLSLHAYTRVYLSVDVRARMYYVCQ